MALTRPVLWAWSFCYDGLVDLVPSIVIEDYLKSGKPLDDMPVVVPNLAESWEVSKDGLDYTFHLRKDVTFHNGKDFKAEDVDFCLKRVLSKPVASSSATKFQSMKEVKVLDDHTIRITLKNPLAPFLAFCNMNLSIIAKDSLPMDKLMRTAPKDGPPLPAGTGPFIPSVWKPGREINFTKFKDFREPGLPYLDGVNLLRVMETTVRYTGLRTGELDWITGVGRKYWLTSWRARSRNGTCISKKKITPSMFPTWDLSSASPSICARRPSTISA